MYRVLAYVAALTLTVPTVAAARGGHAGARLWLVPMSTKVALGDDVHAFVFIENRGKAPIRVPKEFGRRLLYVLQRPDGTPDECTCAVRADFDGTRDDTVLVPPNGVFGASVQYPVATELGRWRLKVSFFSPKSLFSDMITGTHPSPWISYTVTDSSKESPNTALHAPVAGVGRR